MKQVPCRKATLCCAIIAVVTCSATYPNRALSQAHRPDHPVLQELRFEGFKMGAVRTMDVGASIARAVMYRSQFIEAKPASTRLELQQPCDIKNGFAHYRLNAGSVAGAPLSTQPPVSLVFVEQIDSMSKTPTYAGVHPDGSIDRKLWMETTPGSRRYMHVWFSHATFTPADCHFTPVPVGASSARFDQGTAPAYSVVYMGRNESGFLKFAAIRPDGSDSGELLIPAQPGTYNLHGLEFRVLDAGQYKVTYEITFGGTPDANWR